MKVVLSTGIGRLHLISSAQSLAKAGVNVKLVTGWAPAKPNGILVKIASKLVGRNLVPGMQKRMIANPPYVVMSCAFPEFMSQFIRMACSVLRVPFGYFSSAPWTVFGWQTRHYLRDENVFHVRSGAGQGGAIKAAKKLGMKVLVDHSALHPAQTEINLKPDCERWCEPLPIAPRMGVWKNVLKDCELADILMVNANHIRDSFVERGYPKEKIRVVYLGVRTDFQEVTIKRIESGKINTLPRVLFTGAFYLLKGAEYVLESLSILVARGVRVSYDIVGSINIPKGLMDKSRGLPVVFHGPVPQDALKQFLAESDIYVFPSLADGCAQSGMEALTAGLPVVATYQSGLPITDEETGCVIPMKSAKAIADKVQYLIEHPEERLRLGQNAAKMMRDNYTWDKYADNVKSIYKEMVGNG